MNTLEPKAGERVRNVRVTEDTISDALFLEATLYKEII